MKTTESSIGLMLISSLEILCLPTTMEFSTHKSIFLRIFKENVFFFSPRKSHGDRTSAIHIFLNHYFVFEKTHIFPVIFMLFKSFYVFQNL